MEERKLRLITAVLAATSVIFLILFIVFVSLYASNKCTDHDVTGFGYLLEKHGASNTDFTSLENTITKKYGKPLFFSSSSKNTADLTAIVVLRHEVKAADLTAYLNKAASRSLQLDSSSGFFVSDGKSTEFPSCGVFSQVTQTTTKTTPVPTSVVTTTPGTTTPTTPAPVTCPICSTCATCPTCPPPSTCPPPITPKTIEQSVCDKVASDIVFVVDVMKPLGQDIDTKFNVLEKELSAFANLFNLNGTESRIALLGVSVDGVVTNENVEFASSQAELDVQLSETLAARNDNTTHVIDLNDAIEKLINAKTYRTPVNTMVVVIADHTDLNVASTSGFHTIQNYNKFLFALITPTEILSLHSFISNNIPSTPAFQLGADSDDLSYSNLDQTMIPFLERIICNYHINNGPPVPPVTTTTTTTTVTATAKSTTTHVPTKSTAKPSTTVSTTISAVKPTQHKAANELAAKILTKATTDCEKLYIMFIIDISQSIDNVQCKQVQQFLEAFVPQFSVSKEMTSMAAITFALNSTVIVDFNQTTDSQDFLDAFNNEYKCGRTDVAGRTDLQKAFEKASELLINNTAINYKNGVVITFTDGYPTYGLNDNLPEDAKNLKTLSTLFFVGIDGTNGGFEDPTDSAALAALAGGSQFVYQNIESATNGDSTLKQASMTGAITDMFKCPPQPIDYHLCKTVFFVMEVTEIVHESRNATLQTFAKIASEFNSVDNRTAFSFIYYNVDADYYPSAARKLSSYDEFLKVLDDVESRDGWKKIARGRTYLAKALDFVSGEMYKFYGNYDTFSPTIIIAGQTTVDKILDYNLVEASVAELQKNVYQNDNRFFGLDVTVGSVSQLLQKKFWQKLFKPTAVVKYQDSATPFNLDGTDIVQHFSSQTCTEISIQPCKQSFDFILAVHDYILPANRDHLLNNAYDVLEGFTDKDLMEIAVISYGGGKAKTLLNLQPAPATLQNLTLGIPDATVDDSNDINSALEYIKTNIKGSAGVQQIILFVADDFKSVGQATCTAFTDAVKKWHASQDRNECAQAPHIYGLTNDGSDMCTGEDSKYITKKTFDCPLAHRHDQHIMNIQNIINEICKTHTDDNCEPCTCHASCSQAHNVVERFAQVWDY